MALRQLLAVIQLACLAHVAAEARKSLRDGTAADPNAAQLSPVVKQASLLELTNATLAQRLRDVASPEKCIIFTTTSAFLPPLLNMTRNWFAHVHKVGRGANAMVISQDAGTCASLLALGIPCYLDMASPRAWELPEGARYHDRPYDYGKIWWSLRMAGLGYTALYLDNDVAVLRDPITPAYVGSPYDIQGLSDFRKAELPSLGGMLDDRCPLYRLKKDDSAPGGDVFHPEFEVEGSDVIMRALAPCQSLGAFYVSPTPASQRFLEVLSHRIMHTHPKQWDQAAWNEVIMGFLVGMGHNDPLRYRLLPVDEFCNIEVWEQRQAQTLPLRPVLLHAGYMNGEAKTQTFQKMGLWAAAEWDPSMAPAVLKRRLSKGGSRAGLLKVAAMLGGLASLGAWAWQRSLGAFLDSALQGQRRWRRLGPR